MRRIAAYASSLAAAIVLGGAPAPAATVTYYGSFDALYLALAPEPEVEFFNYSTLDSGVTFETTNGHPDANPSRRYFRDNVTAGVASTTFYFPTLVDGFGAWFDLSIGGLGQGLKFTLLFDGGGTQVLDFAVPYPVGFLGLTSSDALTGFRIEGRDAAINGTETYTMDDLVFGNLPAPPPPPEEPEPAAVPEPATWAAMLGGFGLIGVATRRRRRTVSA